MSTKKRNSPKINLQEVKHLSQLFATSPPPPSPLQHGTEDLETSQKYTSHVNHSLSCNSEFHTHLAWRSPSQRETMSWKKRERSLSQVYSAPPLWSTLVDSEGQTFVSLSEKRSLTPLRPVCMYLTSEAGHRTHQQPINIWHKTMESRQIHTHSEVATCSVATSQILMALMASGSSGDTLKTGVYCTGGQNFVGYKKKIRKKNSSKVDLLLFVNILSASVFFFFFWYNMWV